jgi:integrase
VFPLRDSDVLKLIGDIERIERYAQSSKADELLRRRDRALIALNWTFFKRASEILRVRLNDVVITDAELDVVFRIAKKRKTYRVCGGCGEKNAKKALFCKVCGVSIRDVKVVMGGKEVTVVKRKSRESVFCRFIEEWLLLVKRLGCPKEGYLFASYDTTQQEFNWQKHLTVQRFDQILQRIDPTLTSSMFRYAGAEKYLRAGYTPFEVKEIGDWSTSQMPEIYAKRKSLTPSQNKFANDIKLI